MVKLLNSLPQDVGMAINLDSFERELEIRLSVAGAKLHSLESEC